MSGYDKQRAERRSIAGGRPGNKVTVVESSHQAEQARKDAAILEQANRALTLSRVRRVLTEKAGPVSWRSLEELSESPEFAELMNREFPLPGPDWNSIDRRTFLKIMGASFFMAGLAACTRQPEERIVPYVRPPEQLLPGKPLFFASAVPHCGYACGILVKSEMGRPIKIEGNPDHPASLGGTNAITQASILNLYDPDRSKDVTHLGQAGTWDTFVTALNERLAQQDTNGGAGLRILTGTVTSPSLAHQIQRVLNRFPGAKWHQYDPALRDNPREGARMAFGEYVESVYRFDRADVVLSLDSDFLQWGPGHARYVRDFTARRKMRKNGANLNRLYAVECVPGLTGANADHRLAVKSRDVEELARALAAELGIDADPAETKEVRRHTGWIAAVARDLRRHHGSCLVLAGDRQPPEVHALAHAMNDALGSSGRTVTQIEPVEARPESQRESLEDLVAEMQNGRVDTLIIADANPLYNTPADVAFAEHLERVPFRAHMGPYEDETAAACHWHIPQAHFLESWSDARAFDGTASIVQPLIEPLYRSRSPHELMAALNGMADARDYDIVRTFWEARGLAGDFERTWRKALHDGAIEGTAAQEKSLQATTRIPRAGGSTDDGIEIAFSLDDAVWDGQFANNAWLQEMPRSVTKLTWDNAMLVSPATAEQLGVTNEDVIELRYRNRTVRGPVWITPGHADGSVSVQLGYGRWRAGRVGTGVGFNAYSVRPSGAPWFDSGVSVRKTGERLKLATTQDHHRMEGRHLVRSSTLARFRKNPAFARDLKHDPGPEESMYRGHDYGTGYSWGMTIDLNSCIGCSACLVACQAENNVPVVGKSEVRKGREMHWIRIDRYYEGGIDDPQTHFQPVTCMHCENAPCEPVCPVGATIHDSEGLNVMVYNRCVGTRYCSNNCPYKVRRFNFFQYTDEATPSLSLLRNPDVTVRTQGVMEKCTYCVQRINQARVSSQLDGREIRDGELQTACQQACPAQAIAFGNMNDPNSEVVKQKARPLNYALLEEINTRPRTTYLAKVKNPNPELTEEADS